MVTGYGDVGHAPAAAEVGLCFGGSSTATAITVVPSVVSLHCAPQTPSAPHRLLTHPQHSTDTSTAHKNHQRPLGPTDSTKSATRLMWSLGMLAVGHAPAAGEVGRRLGRQQRCHWLQQACNQAAVRQSSAAKCCLPLTAPHRHLQHATNILSAPWAPRTAPSPPLS